MNNIDEQVIQEWWDTYIHSLGKLNLKLLPYRPDFMVISPVKTGTTWLFENLRCHPDIFIPPQKEVRFFSYCWKWLDINWYLNQFKGFEHFTKGEISPDYAIIPERIIKLISKLMPQVKIIFLMRNPVDRAWSNAKQNYKYRQLNFRGFTGDFHSISREKWLENFTLSENLLYNDYYGTLKAWLKFFPKKQFFTGFYESIKIDPYRLLMDVFKFLSVKDDVKWSDFPVAKKINSTIKKDLPSELKDYLSSINVKKMSHLSVFLMKEFNLKIPAEWEDILNYKWIEHMVETDNEKPQIERLIKWWHEGDEIAFNVEVDYKGFNIVIHMDKYHAFSASLGHIYIPGIDKERLKKYEKECKYAAGYTLEEVKKKVNEFVSKEVK